MKLIDQIIEILSTQNGSLSEALIKSKVLLHQIGHKELVTWVNKELNGYDDADELPDYRIVNAQVLVNAMNTAYQVTNHPIPLGHLDKDYRNSLETGKMPQSLAIIEEFAKNSGGSLRSPIPMEANGLLGEGLANGYQIQKAWCEVSTTSVSNILVQVRSRLLDFILELSEKLDGAESIIDIKEKVNLFDATNLFNNAIFGNNATIIVGPGNTQTVKIQVSKNNLDELKSVLSQNGVSENDISLLKEAIREDDKIVGEKPSGFGPAVKLWLQKMLSKAVDASWQIELGIAGNLLSSALNNYYGIV